MLKNLIPAPLMRLACGFLIPGLIVLVPLWLGNQHLGVCFGAISHNRFYHLGMTGILSSGIYLVFGVRSTKASPQSNSSKSKLAYLTIPLFAIALCWHLMGLFVFSVMPIGFKHIDIIRTHRSTYHLDLIIGFDRNYRLIQCPKVGVCRSLAQSRDERSRTGEQLEIVGNSIMAKSVDKPDPILWNRYDQNGQVIDVVDRFPLD